MTKDIPAVAIEQQDVFELALGIPIVPGCKILDQILDEVAKLIKALLVSMNHFRPKRVTRRQRGSATSAVSLPIAPMQSPPKKRHRFMSKNTLKLECLLGNLELPELALIEHGARFWSQQQQLGQNDFQDLHLIQQLDELLKRWLCFC
jgi:hypothetical protein